MIAQAKKRENNLQIFSKSFLALILCLLVRLIPLRAPNVEPILATLMPFSKAYGAFTGFFFAVSSILLYDGLTNTLGTQTFFTAIAYGTIGIWASYYFKRGKINKMSYVRFAIMGTLFFDAFTGLTVGPIFFHQSLLNSLVGQIPFTVLHLLGNIIFAIVLSPAIYNLLVKKEEPEKQLQPLINILSPKTI